MNIETPSSVGAFSVETLEEHRLCPMSLVALGSSGEGAAPLRVDPLEPHIVIPGGPYTTLVSCD